MDKFAIVEKENRLHVHCIFSSRERAETFLRETIPAYAARKVWDDKTLTASDFEIIEYKFQTRKGSKK